MNTLEFAEKKGYYKNGLLIGEKTLKEIEREYKKNENDKKKYFIVKAKKDKGFTLLPNDVSFWNWDVKNIIW